MRLERGERFVSRPMTSPASSERASTVTGNLPDDVAVGNRIYLQDGQIALRIVGKTATEIETIVEFGGELRPTQGINYPDGTLNIDAGHRSRPRVSSQFGLEQGVDCVAVSFVRSAEDIERVEAFIADRGTTRPVIAKIEKHEALDDSTRSSMTADGIMVARGDLGIEIPLEHGADGAESASSRE